MSAFIESLNRYGDAAIRLAWPMLWQSSLLIALLFGLELALRRKVRAAIRYALWLVVLVKLVLPPALALPTGLAWWLRPAAPAPISPHRSTAFVVSYPTTTLPSLPLSAAPVYTPPVALPPAQLSVSAWALVAWSAVGLGLLGWLTTRWGGVTRNVRRATQPPDQLTGLVDAWALPVKLPSSVRLRLTDRPMSPAVCGLFRPVILLPASLAERLPQVQLRAVLLHELFHLRRGDVWVNCAQALLQIVYWWHPLLWLANARIRRLREEAVDDSVMLALGNEAESYAPTLLEVAKFAFNRPLASLGLVGILESQNALRQRIERLIDFRPPRKAGLTLVSVFAILAFGAMALPMGEAPAGSTAGSSDVAAREAHGALVPTSPRERDATTLHTRTFKIDPGTGLANLRKQAGLTETSELKEPVQALCKLLSAAGVQMSPTNIVFNDQGLFLARGTEEQLTLVEQVVEALNGLPPRKTQPAAATSAIAARTNVPAILPGFSTNLYIRTFKVVTNTFAANLQKQTGLQTNVLAALRRLLSNAGVDLSLPKSIFYNSGKGELIVRATMQELDTVEQTIQVLTYTPPQVNIKARFVEMSEDDSKALGIDWPPGGLRMTNTATALPGKISPPSNGISVVPGQPLTNGLRNATTAAGQFTGMLTDPQYRAVLKALEQRSGVEILGEPQITLMSGRRGQIRVEDTRDVILSPPILTNSFSFPSTKFIDDSEYGSNLTWRANQLHGLPGKPGPVLDFIPNVLDDGYTIDLTLIPTLTEFVGYETPPTLPPLPAGTVLVPSVLPAFRARSVITKVRVWDGETVVFSMPLGAGTNFVLFVTPTIIDQAGNRLHKEEEMPFAQKGVPPQTAHATKTD